MRKIAQIVIGGSGPQGAACVALADDGSCWILESRIGSYGSKAVSDYYWARLPELPPPVADEGEGGSSS